LPRTITFVIGQEKKVKQKRAPLSRRKMTFCFSVIMASQIDAKKWSVARRLGPINP
jgi:hypothetical protein